VRTYGIYGTTVQSAAPLPELVPVRGSAEVDFEIEVVPCPAPVDSGRAHPVTRRLLPDGSVWLDLGRTSEGFTLSFPSVARFAVTSGRPVRIRCSSDDGLLSSTVRHLLLDQVIPLALSVIGRPAFHASAIVLESSVVAFAGNAGRGKSTLAASFAAMGAPAFSDDCLVLTDSGPPVLVGAGYSSLRLWPDTVKAIVGDAPLPRVASYSDKRRFGAEDGLLMEPARTLPLRCLYVLGDPSKSVEFVALSPRDALIELVKLTYLMDPCDPAVLAWQFRHLMPLARAGMVFGLRYPRDYTALETVTQAVVEHAASQGCPA
jgi:hypothetical protein